MSERETLLLCCYKSVLLCLDVYSCFSVFVSLYVWVLFSVHVYRNAYGLLLDLLCVSFYIYVSLCMCICMHGSLTCAFVYVLLDMSYCIILLSFCSFLFICWSVSLYSFFSAIVYLCVSICFCCLILFVILWLYIIVCGFVSGFVCFLFLSVRVCIFE